MIVQALVVHIQYLFMLTPEPVTDMGKGLAHIEQTPTQVFNQSAFWFYTAYLVF